MSTNAPGEFHEPWGALAYPAGLSFSVVPDAEPYPWNETPRAYGTFSAPSTDETQRLRDRLVLCVNALEGVPSETLLHPTDAHKLAFAVLRNQADVGVLADFIQEARRGDLEAESGVSPFVPRESILEAMGGLKRAFPTMDGSRVVVFSREDYELLCQAAGVPITVSWGTPRKEIDRLVEMSRHIGVVEREVQRALEAEIEEVRLHCPHPRTKYHPGFDLSDDWEECLDCGSEVPR